MLLALGVAAATLLALVNVFLMFTPAELPISDEPACGTSNVMILIAQTVPSASSVPCVEALPSGWETGQVDVRRGRARFWLNSDREGHHAVEIALRARDECAVGDAVEVPSDELGMRRYERIEQLPPDLRATRIYLGQGTCVVYRFRFDGESNASAMVALDAALRFQPRQVLIDEIAARTGLTLCGAGATRCVDDD